MATQADILGQEVLKQGRLGHFGVPAGQLDMEDPGARLKRQFQNIGQYLSGNMDQTMPGDIRELFGSKLPEMMDAFRQQGVNAQYDPMAAFELAGSAVVGGVPGMPKPTPRSVDVGMLLGRSARKVDMDKMGLAAYMQESGDVSPKRIHELTGMSSGLVDVDWRWEISDKAAKISKDEAVKMTTAMNRDEMYAESLEKVMPHPELFDNYPDFKDILVVPQRGTGGSFDTRLNAIRVGVDQPAGEVRQTIIHEIQHAVQEKEGWPVGGSPDMWGRATRDEYVQAGKDLDTINELAYAAIQYRDGKFTKAEAAKYIDKHTTIQPVFYNKILDSKASGPDFYDNITKARKQYSDIIIKWKKDMQRYMKLAGEKEARIAENRSRLTSEEQAKSDPFDVRGGPFEAIYE